MQDTSVSILSDITTYMKYARYLPHKDRRETWEEIVERNMSMHMKKFPHLSSEIRGAYAYVSHKKVVPSMRSMQFAGQAVETNNARMYNCSFLPIDDVAAFSEVFFLLLGGTGVGYSVQEEDVAKLPPILGEAELAQDEGPRTFTVEDSIEGWADSVGELVETFFYNKKPVRFDYSNIRPKGSPLVTTGGRAPGPGPLTQCHTAIERLLRGVVRERGAGSALQPVEVHDIICHIADAVLAGGIRRAALISLFSPGDEAMFSAKSGRWWETHPERARANNSVVVDRNTVSESEFREFWEYAQRSGSGEPGIFFTNDPRYGANPCAEISLQPFQFCNLTEINVSNVENQEDLNNRARAAAFIGTLQASYTDFHYIRDVWKETTESEALLGVS
ncbi:MAG: recombinase, partial [Spirochaetota bacterium]